MPSTTAIRAGRAFVELFADDSKLVRGLRRAERKLKAFGASVQHIGRKVALVGAAASAPFAAGAFAFTRFDDQMRAVRAATGAAGEAFKSLTNQARQLGRTTNYSAATVAQAMTDLGRAGFSGGQIAQAAKATLDLATATGTDLPTATRIAINMLKGFHLAASKSAHVADVLTQGANASAIDVMDLGESLKYVGAIANTIHAPFEDIVTQLALLGNAGIKGTQAGTSLRRMLINLSQTAKQNDLKQIGVQALDAAGNLRPLREILADLNQATAQMGTAQKTALFSNIFGARAVTAAEALAQDTGQAWRQMAKAVKNSAGVAEKQAEMMSGGMGGALRRLWNNIQDIGISLGQPLTRPFKRLADLLTDLSTRFAAWAQKNAGLIRSLVEIAVATAGAGVALIALGGAIKLAGTAMGVLSTVAGVTGTLVGAMVTALGAMLSPMGLVITAAAALGGAIVYASGVGGKAIQWLQGVFGDLANTAKQAFAGISDALAAGDISLAAKVLWQALKLEFLKGVTSLEKLWAAFKANFLTVAAKAWYGAVKLAIGAWAGLRAAWVETVSFLKSAWISFSSTIQSAWNKAEGFITRGILRIHGAFDKSFNAQAAIQIANQQTQSALGRINSQANRGQQANTQWRQNKLAAIGQDFNAAAQHLDEAANKAAKANHEAAQKKIAAAEQRLEQARRDYQASLAEAHQAARDAKKHPGNTTPSLKQALANLDIGDVLSRAVNGGIDVRGTFNARAIQSLAVSSGPAQRTAEATEQTARNTKKIARKIASSQATFK